MDLSRLWRLFFASTVLLLGSTSCSRIGFDDTPLGVRDAREASPHDAGPDRSLDQDVADQRTPDAPRDLVAADGAPDLTGPDQRVDVVQQDIAPKPADASSDLSCGVAISQTSSSGGYLSVYVSRAYAQLFTTPVSGKLHRVEVYQQTLNGGASFALRLALTHVANGEPSGAALAEHTVGPLGAGWAKYSVDFSQDNIQLSQGKSYALRLSSESPQSTRHTVAFGTRANTSAGALLVQSASGWVPAASAVSLLNSSDVIYFQVFVCP